MKQVEHDRLAREREARDAARANADARRVHVRHRELLCRDRPGDVERAKNIDPVRHGQFAVDLERELAFVAGRSNARVGIVDKPVQRSEIRVGQSHVDRRRVADRAADRSSLAV